MREHCLGLLTKALIANNEVEASNGLDSRVETSAVCLEHEIFSSVMSPEVYKLQVNKKVCVAVDSLCTDAVYDWVGGCSEPGHQIWHSFHKLPIKRGAYY